MSAETHAPVGMKVMYAVWVWLLVLTILEVVMAYLQMPVLLMIALLLALSLVKSGLIMSWFMHLKFERMSLAATIIPGLIMCIVLMNVIWGDSHRVITKGVFRDNHDLQTGMIEKPSEHAESPAETAPVETAPAGATESGEPAAQ